MNKFNSIEFLAGVAERKLAHDAARKPDHVSYASPLASENAKLRATIAHILTWLERHSDVDERADGSQVPNQANQLLAELQAMEDRRINYEREPAPSVKHMIGAALRLVLRDAERDERKISSGTEIVVRAALEAMK